MKNVSCCMDVGKTIFWRGKNKFNFRIFHFNYSHHYALLGAHFLSIGFSVLIIKENFILYFFFLSSFHFFSNQAEKSWKSIKNKKFLFKLSLFTSFYMEYAYV